MSHPPRPLPPTLLPSLNALLAVLDLPFTLDTPTDLTPSLLLAILESLINARLPIPATVRASRTRDARTRAMLVFLGVLECDVLRGGVDSTNPVADTSVEGPGSVSVDGWADDIGLGEVDPQKLADGGWDETVFVGELMCWLARRKRILPRLGRGSSSSSWSQRAGGSMRSVYPHPHSYTSEDASHEDFSTSLLLRPSPSHRSHLPPDDDVDGDTSALSHITDVPRHPLVHSPDQSLSETTTTDLSLRIPSSSSRTSVSHGYDDQSLTSDGTAHPYSYYHDRDRPRDASIDDEDDNDEPPVFHPRCIHELEDPSYIRALGGDPSSSSLLDVHLDERGDGDDSRYGMLPCSDDEDDGRNHEEDIDDPHPYVPPTPTPRRVRMTGWIDEVDTQLELSAFKAGRSKEGTRSLGSSGISMKDTMKTPRSGASRSGPQVTGSDSAKARQDSIVSPMRTMSLYDGGPSSLSTPAKSMSKSILKTPSSSSVPKSKPAPAVAESDDDDPPFDISFSTPLNTSTPAKPKPQKTHHVRIGTVDMQEQRQRSPSYTPSPPSFSNPKTPVPTRATVSSSTSTSTKRADATHRAPALSSSKGRSTTTMTSSLLNERARLLTELAALKRARAASGGGAVVGVQ